MSHCENNSNFKLTQWYAKHRVSHVCAIHLIKILREENIIVSSFYRSQCPFSPKIVNIVGGQYLHMGLKKQLENISRSLNLATI